MSYFEYRDIFEAAQKRRCPYRAFYFDVVGSKKEDKNNAEFVIMNHKLYDMMTEKLLNLGYLKVDSCNYVNLVKNHNLMPEEVRINANLWNPMIIGDGVCYFVHNNSITNDQVIKLFVECLKEINIKWDYHFATGVYETDDYGLRCEKMYKGYMFPFLENNDKKNKNRIIINKDTVINEEDCNLK